VEFIHWIGVGLVLAVVAVGGFLVMPLYRGWKPLNERMAEQVTASAELSRECNTQFGCGTGFARLSTIR
jgi:hypothetical protein